MMRYSVTERTRYISYYFGGERDIEKYAHFALGRKFSYERSVRKTRIVAAAVRSMEPS